MKSPSLTYFFSVLHLGKVSGVLFVICDMHFLIFCFLIVVKCAKCEMNILNILSVYFSSFKHIYIIVK